MNKLGAGILLMMVLFCGGCGNTELEDREFPVLLTVTTEGQFTGEWNKALQSSAKKLDYNHLKAILVEREFLEEEERMAEMLEVLKEDRNIPLNAYVLTTDTLGEIEAAEEKLEMPLGNYLEALLEQTENVKKETYPTVGMLYQEEENKLETLFVPYLSVVEEKPEIVAYEVYQRGEAKGLVQPEVAVLSFFLTNQTDNYVLQADMDNYVELTNEKNDLSAELLREPSGREITQITVQVCCDAKVLYGKAKGMGAKERKTLEAEIERYFANIAENALKKGVDITNSRKKFGVDENNPEIIFELDLNWID